MTPLHAQAGLDAQALLQAWEAAQPLALPRRADALLGLAWPEVAPDEWGTVPLGVRETRLFLLHEALFGPSLELLADCPACGEVLELSLRTTDLRAEPRLDGDELSRLECEGYELTYRLPGMDDLAVAAREASSSDEAIARLLQRCLRQARHALAPGIWPVCSNTYRLVSRCCVGASPRCSSRRGTRSLRWWRTKRPRLRGPWCVTHPNRRHPNPGRTPTRAASRLPRRCRLLVRGPA